jgi:phage baseplate assembly protein V
MTALARRIRMLLARSVVTLVNDALMVQGLQVTVLDGETAQVQRFQNYGFSSVPLSGAEAILAAIAGARSHLVALAVDDGRYRLKNLQDGEVAIYTDEGDSIVLKRGRIMQVTAGNELDVSAPVVKVTATTSVTLDSPTVTCTHDLQVGGKIHADSDITTDTQVTATTQVTAAGITLTSRAAA